MRTEYFKMWISGYWFTLFTGTIIVCSIVIGVTVWASSPAAFEQWRGYIQESKTYDTGRDANGDYHPDRVCTGCSKVHGAPGPVMGVAGAPLIAAYGVYRLWRRRRNHQPA
jgi:hypothetical protein